MKKSNIALIALGCVLLASITLNIVQYSMANKTTGPVGTYGTKYDDPNDAQYLSLLDDNTYVLWDPGKVLAEGEYADNGNGSYLMLVNGRADASWQILRLNSTIYAFYQGEPIKVFSKTSDTPAILGR